MRISFRIYAFRHTGTQVLCRSLFYIPRWLRRLCSGRPRRVEHLGNKTARSRNSRRVNSHTRVNTCRHEAATQEEPEYPESLATLARTLGQRSAWRTRRGGDLVRLRRGGAGDMDMLRLKKEKQAGGGGGGGGGSRIRTVTLNW